MPALGRWYSAAQWARPIGGQGSTYFNNIRITNTVGVTLVDDVTVYGNWINDGQFNPSTYGVIFAGTAAQIIGGSVITNFYNVTFQNNISVTLNLDIYVLGNFVNTGVFYGYQTVGSVRTGYYVRFGGGTAQLITAGAQTYFYHFYVDNTAGVSLGTNITSPATTICTTGSSTPALTCVISTASAGMSRPWAATRPWRSTAGTLDLAPRCG